METDTIDTYIKPDKVEVWPEAVTIWKNGVVVGKYTTKQFGRFDGQLHYAILEKDDD